MCYVGVLQDAATLAIVPADVTSNPYTHNNPQTMSGHKRKLESSAGRAGNGAEPNAIEAK